MGCGTSRGAPDDVAEPSADYDPKWDELRDRFKASKSGKGSDGHAASEPGACGSCFARKTYSLRAVVSLAFSGATFKPQDPPGSPGSSEYLSSRDRSKIQQWLEGIGSAEAEMAPEASRLSVGGSGQQGHHRQSVHTVYSQDDDEELIRANSGEGSDFIGQPQRLTDKKSINRLQVQLKARERDKRKKGQSSDGGADEPPEEDPPVDPLPLPGQSNVQD